MSGARGPRDRFSDKELAVAVARIYHRERNGISYVPPSTIRNALVRAGYLTNPRHGVWWLTGEALDVAMARAMNEQAKRERNNVR